nr:class I SAM-dependent methyltransferase [Nocardioides panaciterrulae]
MRGEDARRARVLDAGAGTGRLTAALLSTGAAVSAVDPDEAMLALAAETAPDAQLGRAALPHLPYAAASFDVTVANFVVNHVADPRAGLRELARVTRRGGRVVVTIWPSGHNTQSRLWAEVLEASGARDVPATRLPAALDFPRTVDGLSGLLKGAGLRQVASGTLRWTHRTTPDALWRGADAGIGGIGTTLRAQTAAVRARMKLEHDRCVRSLTHAGELVLPTTAILAVGTRS